MKSAQYQQALARVRDKAMAQVKTIAVVRGQTVVSHHSDFKEANIALCRELDVYCAQEENAGVPHNLDIVPLRSLPLVGANYDNADIVIIP